MHLFSQALTKRGRVDGLSERWLLCGVCVEMSKDSLVEVVQHNWIA